MAFAQIVYSPGDSGIVAMIATGDRKNAWVKLYPDMEAAAFEARAHKFLSPEGADRLYGYRSVEPIGATFNLLVPRLLPTVGWVVLPSPEHTYDA